MAAASGKSTKARSGGSSKKSGGRRTSASASRADKSVEAFRDALERSVTISRDRLQEVVDESVKRGRMTSRDAEELVSNLVTRGRKYQNELLRDLEKLVKDARKEVEARAAEVRKELDARSAEVRRRADKATSRARSRTTAAASRAGRRARDLGDEPLKRLDEARRRVGAPPTFPITAYDQLTVPQIKSRLAKLAPAELRKVRTYEKANEARKGILGELDRRLGNGKPATRRKPAARKASSSGKSTKKSTAKSTRRAPARGGSRRSTSSRRSG